MKPATKQAYRVAIWHIAKKAIIPCIIAKIENEGIAVENNYDGHLLLCYTPTKELAKEIIDFAHSLTNCTTELLEVK